MKIEAFFLDRDGTINVDKGYTYSWDDFEYLPGAVNALKLIQEQAIPIHIITNQSGIAKGYYTESQMHDLHDAMKEDLLAEGVKIKTISYCPHHEEGHIENLNIKCHCRKPEPGLLLDLLKDYNYDARHVVMVGDKASDIEAGQNAGVKTALVRTGLGKESEKLCNPDYITDDLLTLCQKILAKD